MENIFIQGAIQPATVATTIANYQEKPQVGAYDIFLGQIRADDIEGQKVKAISYTAHEKMALYICHQLKEKIISKYVDLHSIAVFHSLGEVTVEELCFFVLVSSGHRKAAFEACHEFVNTFKAEVPIFGKELFEDDSHQWKVNR